MLRTSGRLRDLGLIAKALSRPLLTSPILTRPLSEWKEADRYQWWKERGYFKPKKRGSEEKYSLILPPPNVTGTLHLGHALTVAVQDAIVRWRRMQGKEVLWVPGSDHAGIATQAVVEKTLKKSRNATRQQLGREKFLEEVWKWREDKGNVIFKQLETMGASLDWDRTSFTMSETHTKAVNKAFIQLFDKGLIYRSDYLVNWSCALGSAISDIEVDHKILEGRTKVNVPGYEKPVEMGIIYDLSYKVENSEKESIIFSTTRPETLLGDTAVAVHPQDPRYASLIGKNLTHPFRNDPIPIVADEHVNPEFGTGAVKVTPGHDPNDFEIGKRHDLEKMTVISEEGKIKLKGSDFNNVPRFDARWLVLRAMNQLGLFHGKREHPMSIPICSRTGDVIEPLIKPQWFLKTKEMNRRALEASESGHLQFQPENHKVIWKHWLADNPDWCLSRQLWWGHRIPVYRFYDDKGNFTHVAAESSAEALSKLVERLGGIDHQGLLAEQDEDVLDTWFSSALLPFANFGWPENTEDLGRFYPLNIMETGHDILFFWVARMVMLGQELTGKLPFNKVLLHGIVCDAHGRKMSKSLGNIIDPIDVINGKCLEDLVTGVDKSKAAGSISDTESEKAKAGLKKFFPEGIPECGVDALRFGLCHTDVKSEQINMDINIIRTARAFLNKIRNCAKFLEMSCARIDPEKLGCIDLKNMTSKKPEDLWILSRAGSAVREINQAMENNEFHQATRVTRRFLYSEICDVYLECVKVRLQDPSCEGFEATLSTFYKVFLTGIKLIHPFMPFITEEIYQNLPKLQGEQWVESIMISNFPEPSDQSEHINATLECDMESALNITSAIRNLKQTYELKFSNLPEIILSKESGDLASLGPFTELIQNLSKCGSVSFKQPCDLSGLDNYASVVSEGDYKVFMKVQGLVNLQKELDKADSKKQKLLKQIKKIDDLMSKPHFQKFTEEKKLSQSNKKQELESSLAILSSHIEFLKKIQ